MLTVLAGALIGIGFLDSLFGFHLNSLLILGEVFLKQEALKLSQDTLNAISRRPSYTFVFHFRSLNHVQTNVSSEDIGMRNAVEKSHSRWIVRVGWGELQFDVEDATFVQRALRSSDVAVPGENVMVQRPCNYTNCGDGLVLDFLEILDQSLVGEGLDFLVDSCAKQSLIC